MGLAFPVSSIEESPCVSVHLPIRIITSREHMKTPFGQPHQLVANSINFSPFVAIKANFKSLLKLDGFQSLQFP